MTDNKKDMRDTYTIYDDQTIGKVQIADEVVAIIAGLAGWKTGYEKPVQRCESRCSGECGMRESEPESGIWIQYSGNL